MCKVESKVLTFYPLFWRLRHFKALKLFPKKRSPAQVTIFTKFFFEPSYYPSMSFQATFRLTKHPPKNTPNFSNFLPNICPIFQKKWFKKFPIFEKNTSKNTQKHLILPKWTRKWPFKPLLKNVLPFFFAQNPFFPKNLYKIAFVAFFSKKKSS